MRRGSRKPAVTVSSASVAFPFPLPQPATVTCYAPSLKAAFLTDSQLADEFLARPGLIPVSIDCSSGEPSSNRIVWLDLDRYHCYEGFFSQSLASYAAMLPSPPARYVTSLDALGCIPLDDCLPPSGLIFHAGRCGSTLLAKILARSRENMVFSEAAAHNLVWKVLPERSRSAVEFYRRLLLAMGRPRLASYRAHFIKFTSFNIVRFELIRAAFPDTPAVFLFRQPDAVLESSAREVQPFLGHDVGLGRIWYRADAAFEDFCNAALGLRDPKFRCLNYSGITPENLPSILQFFRNEPSSRQELALMKSEFLWDAKSGRIPRRFVPRNAAIGLADQCLLGLYEELVGRSRSDWV